MAQKKQSTTGASRDGIAARLAALPAKSPARQLGVSTIIARAKARRPAQAAAVIDGTFQRLGVQFPKTADLLMAAARLPGIADRYRWIETTAGARLAPLADLGLVQTGPRHPDPLIVIGIRLPGRLDVGVAATVATYADDKSAHLALKSVLPELLEPLVRVEGRRTPAGDRLGRAEAELMKAIRRIRTAARESAARRESLVRELQALAGPFLTSLKLLGRRGFRLADGRRLAGSVSPSDGGATIALVAETGHDATPEATTLATAIYDGRTFKGDREIGAAWRAHSLDPAAARAIFAELEHEPGSLLPEESPDLVRFVPVVLAEAAVALGLVAPEQGIDDPALLARIPRDLVPAFSGAVGNARLRRENIARRLELHDRFNSLMKPLIEDCLALAEASLVDAAGNPFLFDLESDEPALPGAGLSQYLNPIATPRLTIEAGRKILVISMHKPGELAYASAITSFSGALPDAVPATEEEARSLRRLALHMVDGQEMIADPSARVFGEVPDETEARALQVALAMPNGSALQSADQDAATGSCLEKHWLAPGRSASRITRQGRAALALYRARRASGQRSPAGAPPPKARRGGSDADGERHIRR